MTAPARITLTKAALETLVAKAVADGIATAFAAQAPAKAAPAKAKASAAFGGMTAPEYFASRKAAALACAIHPAGTCNRTFSPKSSGNAEHVARIV